MIFFSYFSSKPYVVTPYLKRLVETVQMRGHNKCFYAELPKLSQISTKYSFLSRDLLEFSKTPKIYTKYWLP